MSTADKKTFLIVITVIYNYETTYKCYVVFKKHLDNVMKLQQPLYDLLMPVNFKRAKNNLKII